ncbi:bifunctional L-myo-inositol-1-phosphate cytidylyltransferase/CDP-L-myo-inositol myo-inositolphosphotransferase [Archaeoglobus profundus]|uniref:Bifunctional IPC transferase and DIPP synthase n=1 Tax=Archaeoglobus profundus (strain DSM 5631 / JCM 9629 / NBRC 100127 / Av18) TaxID=572546 RepID=D2RHQ4_ARCPA|nr:bifunctional L-myo-inositol-1-phosphate cytidylyltransferase/CDP-L-myo-inositol myo-inositolphosphotransferase [Archaeoglobus profundus]ADB57829.1 CDP-alcohol phosphatidyltransferase [Archaeoglobus profundus DSM 5631]
MKAVVLCAGFGTRMGRTVKPLLKVAGREIMFRNLKLLQDNGIDEFVVVVNNENRKAIEDFLKRNNFKYRIVVNPHPERGNGYSFYLAKDFVDDRFVLVMGDHVYDEEFVRVALRGDGLICDRNPLYVDIDEATKVLVENGRIKRIGKDLKEWCCVDTGFFILTRDVFKYAEEIIDREEIKLSDIIERSRIKVTEISGLFWMDVDTPEELKKANKLLVRKSYKGRGDGFVSRRINRKISLRLSELLVNRITPNQATLISFLVGIFSAILNLFSIPLAGLVYQISSILDGIDGEIARASLRTSKFGGWLDSVLDRYVDFLFLLTLSFVSNLNNLEWIIACFAMFGSFMVSYTTERYKGAFFSDFYNDFDFKFPGKRDERIFLIFLFCLFSFLGKFVIVTLLALIAVITNLRVVTTIYIVYKNKRFV